MMFDALWRSGGPPLITILITISILFICSPPSCSSLPEISIVDPEVDDVTTNVPLENCDDSEHHADVTTIFLEPPCEEAPQGYCGMRRNQNYTLLTKWTPKLQAKAMYVRVTTKDPLYGWETLIWPEFSVCNRFNITCPQESTEVVRTYVKDTLPAEVPPMRALVRVRLLGVAEDNIKRVVICRQFKALVK